MKVSHLIFAFIFSSTAYADLGDSARSVPDIVEIIKEHDSTVIQVFNAKNGVALEVRELMLSAGIEPQDESYSNGDHVYSSIRILTENNQNLYALYIKIGVSDVYVYSNSSRDVFDTTLNRKGYTLEFRGKAAYELLMVMKKGKISRSSSNSAEYKSIECWSKLIGPVCIMKIRH